MNKKWHSLLSPLQQIQSLQKFTLPVALLVLTAACATTSPQTPGNVASATTVDALPSNEQSIAHGDQFYRQGDLQTALIHYITALENEPDSAGILYRIGISNAGLGNTTAATRAFKQILAVSPMHAGANEGLGLQYLNLREYDQARTHLTRAIDADSNRTRAQNALGILADLERDHISAKTHFIAGQGGADVALTHNNVGYSRYLAGDWTAAEQSFQAALAHNPKFERAVNNLGLLYVRKGEYSRAFETFTRSMTAHEAYNNIGYFSMLTGQHENAAHFLQRAIDESPRYYERAEQNLLRNAAEQASQHTLQTRDSVMPEAWVSNARVVPAATVIAPRTSALPMMVAKPTPQSSVSPPHGMAVASFSKDALICKVDADVLRVRKNADPESPSIAAIYKDQEVAILLERNEWVQISYLNNHSQSMRKGWINSDYLQGDTQSTACGALGNGKFGLTAEALGDDDMQAANFQLP